MLKKEIKKVILQYLYVHRAWDYHRATKVAIDQELMGKKG